MAGAPGTLSNERVEGSRSSAPRAKGESHVEESIPAAGCSGVPRRFRGSALRRRSEPRAGGSTVEAVTLGDLYNFGTLAGPGSCMDAQGGGTTDGTQIQEWTCNGTGAQSYELQDDGDGDGAFYIVNPQANKCVDVSGAGTANGTKIQLYDCNGTGAQKFVTQAAANGNVYFVNTNSNKCLDVEADDPANGTVVQLYECNQANAQPGIPPSSVRGLAAGQRLLPGLSTRRLRRACAWTSWGRGRPTAPRCRYGPAPETPISSGPTTAPRSASTTAPCAST